MLRRAGNSRSTPAGEHRPVLMKETLAACGLKPGMRVVDCTVGFGGHSLEILKTIGPTGRLLALDRDAAALELVRPRFEKSEIAANRGIDSAGGWSLHHANYAGLPSVLAESGIERVDVILADLGISSMQIDDSERGFSYAREGPLDMRMDRSKKLTAAELLAKTSESELATALAELGDEPQAKAVAAAIVRHRKRKPIERTNELVEVVLAATVDPSTGRANIGSQVHRGNRTILARVFQTLRILVNRELAGLEQLLRCLPDCLAPSGRAVFISFHSGEDRIVKDAFRNGHRIGVYSEIAPDPIRPSPEEAFDNPRSRSAKLRWAVRADDAIGMT